MKKLLVDLDYVVCINQMVNILNDFFCTNYTNENFPSLFLTDVYTDKDKVSEFLKLHENDNYYIKPEFIPDAKKVLKQLSKYYEIYICTAYVWPENPQNTKTEICSKLDFLYKNFDFIDRKKIVFCSNKNLLNGDIIIDDRLNNLTGSSKVKLLFTSVYNKNIDNKELEKLNVTRVNSWQEIKTLLMKIK